MVTYRLATEQEISNIADLLKKYNLWFTAKNFVHQFYPDTAHHFNMEVEGSYNDEGGTNYNLSALYVKDSQDNYLDYDYTKPAFALAFQDDPDYLEDEEYDEDAITEYLRECYSAPKGADLETWADWEDINNYISNYDDVHDTFYMHSPPVTVPSLYLAIEV